ncbi:MAG: YceI family protein [Gemmatimonadales bacterium]
MRTTSRCWTGFAWLLLLLSPGLAREAAGTQAPPDSVVYRVHPASRLVVKTGKAGLFGFAGHTHVIRARAVSGRLVYHPGKSTSYLRLELPTDSLEVLTPPDTAEIRKVTEAMRTEVLHVDKYPEMTFAADSLSARSGTMEMQLALTMEGTTRTVPVTAEVTLGSDSIRARGTFTAKQTDFGIEPYSGGPAGTVKVADRVTFCFDLLAVRDLARLAGGQPPVSAEDATTVPGCVDKSKANPDPARRPM